MLDITPARSDGRLVVAANGRLRLLRPGRATTAPFAPAYSTPLGPEAYIARSPGQRVPGAGCRFGRDAVFALEPTGRTGVIAIDRSGHARRFADVAGPGLLSGLAFDTTGRFGHRLLVTRSESGGATVLALDCRGRLRDVARTTVPIEGGIAVAPAAFGRFGGQLVGADENSGRIVAVGADGRSRVIARSGLPVGGDIGVESAGFAPPDFDAHWSAYVADRATPGNPHPGSDALLALGGRSLTRAGVRAGDLLVVTEAGAQTIAVRCRRRCTVHHIADGPPAAHVEGHVVFGRHARPER